MGDDFLKKSTSQELEDLMKWAGEITSGHDIEGTKLEFKEDGVYLTVFPPQPGQAPVNPEELVREVTARKITGIEFTKVHTTVREMSGKPVMIAPPQVEEKEDAKCYLEISKNNMEAYLKVDPSQGGEPLTRADVEKLLQENGVVYGVHEDIIERAISLTHPETLTVAQGSNPIDGENATIEFKFETDTKLGKPTETVDGRADFYNLNLIQNVEEGQVLAVKKPATPGTPGYSVKGEEIPAKPGKDIQMAIGKNVELREDNSVAVSTVKGHIQLAGNKISVSNVYEVNGDVDFNTGNIEFKGSVVVKGSIREGFRVTAEGDVDVMNTIADGIVECTGALRVKNGIVGKKSRIKAGGAVATRFIENAAVESGAEVMVGEAVMHSRVSAARSVVVGGKGVIVGGVIRAGEEINCKIVGSTLATATELEAGINPELRQELGRLTKEKETKEQDYQKAEKAVKLLNYIKETQGELPPDKLAILVRVGKVLQQLVIELENIKESMAKIELQIQESERGRIMVQGVIHSGVKVTIGSAYMQIQDDYTFACLKKVGPDIKISPYS